MPSGILGQTNLTTTGTWVNVYTVPAGKVATVNILALNNTTGTSKLSLALSTQASTPTLAEYIENNLNVGGSEVLERGGIVMEAGRKIFVYSVTASPSYSITITGYEE